MQPGAACRKTRQPWAVAAKMDIRALHKNDIVPALDLVREVFDEFEAPEYSREGILEFKNFIAYKNILRKIDADEIRFWGCYNEIGLVGVIAVKDFAHICLLFVKKEYQRQGIAKRLFHTILAHYKTHEGIDKITVNSSPYAVEAYRHLGFINTDSEKTIKGIRFTPMEYKL